MAYQSYSDELSSTGQLRHLFIPNRYAALSEAVIAAGLLILLNIGTISDVLGGHSAGINTTPLSLWHRVIDHTLAGPQANAAVQRGAVIVLWALAGALVYVLVFRLFQVSVRAEGSVRRGAVLVKTQHEQGLMRYFASLHDFFIKALIGSVGFGSLLFGVLICFSIAGQQLGQGLYESFPGNIGYLAVAYLASLLAVRCSAIGLSLLSARFRAWYNA